jgi:hypothetical protein
MRSTRPLRPGGPQRKRQARGNAISVCPELLTRASPGPLDARRSACSLDMRPGRALRCRALVARTSSAHPRGPIVSRAGDAPAVGARRPFDEPVFGAPGPVAAAVAAEHAYPRSERTSRAEPN